MRFLNMLFLHVFLLWNSLYCSLDISPFFSQPYEIKCLILDRLSGSQEYNCNIRNLGFTCKRFYDCIQLYINRDFYSLLYNDLFLHKNAEQERSSYKKYILLIPISWYIRLLQRHTNTLEYLNSTDTKDLRYSSLIHKKNSEEKLLLYQSLLYYQEKKYSIDNRVNIDHFQQWLNEKSFFVIALLAAKIVKKFYRTEDYYKLNFDCMNLLFAKDLKGCIDDKCRIFFDKFIKQDVNSLNLSETYKSHIGHCVVKTIVRHNILVFESIKQIIAEYLRRRYKVLTDYVSEVDEAGYYVIDMPSYIKIENAAIKINMNWFDALDKVRYPEHYYLRHYAFQIHNALNWLMKNKNITEYINAIQFTFYNSIDCSFNAAFLRTILKTINEDKIVTIKTHNLLQSYFNNQSINFLYEIKYNENKNIHYNIKTPDQFIEQTKLFFNKKRGWWYEIPCYLNFFMARAPTLKEYFGQSCFGYYALMFYFVVCVIGQYKSFGLRYWTCVLIVLTSNMLGGLGWFSMPWYVFYAILRDSLMIYNACIKRNVEFFMLGYALLELLIVQESIFYVPLCKIMYQQLFVDHKINIYS